MKEKRSVRQQVQRDEHSSPLMEKLKVGVCVFNGDVPDVNLDDPTSGNPGIGGTTFLHFALPYYIQQFHPDAIQMLLLAENPESIQSGIEIVKLHSLVHAASIARQHACDILVYRPSYDQDNLSFLAKLKELEIKAVAWFHNTPIRLLQKLAANDQIVRCVCVGRAQYESLRDHPVFRKVSLINNAVDPTQINPPESPDRANTVVFLGSIVYAKGFHILARIWKNLLKKHPDAKLYVIGSGKLYNRDQELGPLGIAEASYERLFRRYILKKDGELHESIDFLGILGKEKYELMAQACAGVVNPSIASETFSLSAAEIQLCGTPVVSRARGGLLDTVLHNDGGFLVLKPKQMLSYLDKLLSNKELASRMGSAGRNRIVNKFSYESITKDWIHLFQEVGSDFHGEDSIKEPGEQVDISFIRDKLRQWKECNGIFRLIPPSVYFTQGIESLKLKWLKLRYRF